MTIKSALYALAVVVLTGSMAVVSFAEPPGMKSYGPSDSLESAEAEMSEAESGTVGTQPDAWDLRESMETGALPGQRVDSSEAVCCGGIDEPTIESGGREFRPGIDAAP